MSKRRRVDDDILQGITLADLGIRNSTPMIMIESLTNDSRRVRRQFLAAEPLLPLAPTPPGATTVGTANESNGLDPIPNDDIVVDLSQYTTKNRKRYQKSVSSYTCFLVV